MDTERAAQLYRAYSPAMTYIAVEHENGNAGIGSAFHVGEGVFVTARHVVEGCKISEIKLSEPLRVPLSEAIPEYDPETLKIIGQHVGSQPTWPVYGEPLKLTAGPFFHPDAALDVAVFKVEGIHPSLPFVPLGSHLDDWIRDSDFVLSEAILLGYPPIPFTTEPHLVAARAEINAVIDPRHARKVHFVLSAMPRGGFSGGLALSEFDFVLGLITEALGFNHNPPELGFFTVISIEPIYECLAHHKLLPDCQEGEWDGFWNTTRTELVAPAGTFEGRTVGSIEDDSALVASVGIFDNGKRFYFNIHCYQPNLMKLAVEAGLAALPAVRYEQVNHRDDWIRIHVHCDPANGSAVIKHAGEAVIAALTRNGLRAYRFGESG